MSDFAEAPWRDLNSTPVTKPLPAAHFTNELPARTQLRQLTRASNQLKRLTRSKLRGKLDYLQATHPIEALYQGFLVVTVLKVIDIPSCVTTVKASANPSAVFFQQQNNRRKIASDSLRLVFFPLLAIIIPSLSLNAFSISSNYST
jgi:hypothetical protein